MTKKHKYLLIFLTVTVLFFLNAIPSYSLEVKDYPSLPGVSAPTAGCSPANCLPNYVSYFVGLGIYLGGALAVISLVIGGIQLIFSTVSPEARNNAIDRIKGAILGLVLLVSSVIIIQTINPTLITIISNRPTGLPGVFYIGGIEEEPAPDAKEDNTVCETTSGSEKTTTIAKPNTSSTGCRDTIIYRCPASGEERANPDLLVWKFPEKNFGGYRNATMTRISCGETASVNSPSFRMVRETPGVYYFLKEGCTGLGSRAELSDMKAIEEPFKSEMRSFLILNDINLKDDKKSIYYGTVLHAEINFRGQCSIPLQAYQLTRRCYNISPPIASINIFKLNNRNAGAESETSGNGAVFYSKPFGYKTGSNAGYYILTPKMIKEGIARTTEKFWTSKSNLIDFRDSYAFVDVPKEEKELCKTFKDCPGSIKIQGNYLAILYARGSYSSSGGSFYCQVFNKDVANLKEEEITAVEGRELESVYIIPTK